jgi:hypothetical protein
VERLATPYVFYGSSEIIPAAYPPLGISASAGLISTVIDLAKYDAAVDRHCLLHKATQERVFTPAVSNDGRSLPYGLGWFIQRHRGLKLVWHYGYWPQFSALILKVPERSITFILLANSAGLSAPFGLGAGDVMRSPFACAFLRLFVLEDSAGPTLPNFCWSRGREEFAAELSRLADRPGGYAYEPEATAHAAMTSWLDNKRENARTAIKVDPIVHDAFLGQYAFKILTVTRDGERVFAQMTGQKRFEIFPDSEMAFFWKVMDARVMFVRDDEGKVTHARVHQGGKELVAPRIRETQSGQPGSDVGSDIVGRYAYAILTITREQDRLFAQMTGEPRIEVFPASATEFFSKVLDVLATLVKNEEGMVTHIQIRQADARFEYPKIE